MCAAWLLVVFYLILIIEMYFPSNLFFDFALICFLYLLFVVYMIYITHNNTVYYIYII